jgi:hypothetical protein
MKKRFCSFVMVLVLTISFVVIGCASSKPELGEKTLLQQLLNELPEIQVAGKSLKFEFGGDVWIARVSGKEFMAGTITLEENSEGYVLTLKQTHVYSTEQKPGVGGDVGWVKTPGPDISLEYKKGPPESLSVK